MQAQTRLQSAARMSKAGGYRSITPANNLYLQKKWDQSRFEMHRMKVRNAKPIIDNKPPEIHMHLHLKLKKMQVKEERNAIIQRDNQILLENMAMIMRTKGRRIDNINSYNKRSLNEAQRQRDLLRVALENQAILKRIQSKQPHYNHRQWLDQWRVNKGYMANASKYHHTWMYKEGKKEQKFIRPDKTCSKVITPSEGTKAHGSAMDLTPPVRA